MVRSVRCATWLISTVDCHDIWPRGTQFSLWGFPRAECVGQLILYNLDEQATVETNKTVTEVILIKSGALLTHQSRHASRLSVSIELVWCWSIGLTIEDEAMNVVRPALQGKFCYTGTIMLLVRKGARDNGNRSKACTNLRAIDFGMLRQIIGLSALFGLFKWAHSIGPGNNWHI